MTTITAFDAVYLQGVSPGSVNYSLDNVTYMPITTWPVTIVGDGVTRVVVYFTTDITLNTTSQYFICGSERIQIGEVIRKPDGTLPIITIDSVTNYPGLVRNGTFLANGYSYIYILNLVIDSATSTLLNTGGWFAQGFFAKNATFNYIINCSSNGPIANSAGGIAGTKCGVGSGNLRIRACSSTGDIGNSAGGIIGADAGFSSGTVVVNRCFSTGSIGTSGGGIYGNQAGAAGNVIADRCYSTGIIQTEGGGIFGSSAGATSANAVRCYSTGNISNLGGGIFGQSSGAGAVTENSYSTGTIDTTAGGIYGDSFDVSATATNCYTSGSLAGAAGGIYAGSSIDPALCFSEGNNGNSGTWQDSNASTTLIISGTFAISNIPNTPYELLSFGLYQYDLQTVVFAGDAAFLNAGATFVLVAGGSTPAAVLPAGYTYSFTNNQNEPTITINSSTGVISTITSTPPGIYLLWVRSFINPYSIQLIGLNVTAAASASASICCVSPTALTGLPYDTIAAIRIGNRLIAERASNPNMRFASYSDYTKYKIAL